MTSKRIFSYYFLEIINKTNIEAVDWQVKGDSFKVAGLATSGKGEKLVVCC